MWRIYERTECFHRNRLGDCRVIYPVDDLARPFASGQRKRFGWFLSRRAGHAGRVGFHFARRDANKRAYVYRRAGGDFWGGRRFSVRDDGDRIHSGKPVDGSDVDQTVLPDEERQSVRFYRGPVRVIERADVADDVFDRGRAGAERAASFDGANLSVVTGMDMGVAIVVIAEIGRASCREIVEIRLYGE